MPQSLHWYKKTSFRVLNCNVGTPVTSCWSSPLADTWLWHLQTYTLPLLICSLRLWHITLELTKWETLWLADSPLQLQFLTALLFPPPFQEAFLFYFYSWTALAPSHSHQCGHCSPPSLFSQNLPLGSNPFPSMPSTEDYTFYIFLAAIVN